MWNWSLKFHHYLQNILQYCFKESSWKYLRQSSFSKQTINSNNNLKKKTYNNIINRYKNIEWVRGFAVHSIDTRGKVATKFGLLVLSNLLILLWKILIIKQTFSLPPKILYFTYAVDITFTETIF